MAIKPSIGTSTANSYVSVASADNYFDTLRQATQWDKLSDNTTATGANITKENLLIQATREIDNTYRFQESKYNTDPYGETNYQALEFPRGSNITSANVKFIPLDIKYATYEQALWILQRPQLLTSNEGEKTSSDFIGQDAYNYLKGWVNRQVEAYGSPKWQGSKF